MRMVLAVLFASVLLLCGGASAGWAEEGPSFDCAKAKAPAEKAICGDEELVALDRTICKSNVDCIGGVMRREVPNFQALCFEAPDEQHICGGA